MTESEKQLEEVKYPPLDVIKELQGIRAYFDEKFEAINRSFLTIYHNQQVLEKYLLEIKALIAQKQEIQLKPLKDDNDLKYIG